METLQFLATNIFYVAIPYFALFIGWEYVAMRQLKKYPYAKGYNDWDNLVSNALGISKLVMLVVCAGYTAWTFEWFYAERIFTLSPFEWWTWPVLFVAWDFLYYWYHRLAHRIRLFWAEHVNHHSSEYFNFGTALRQATLAPVYAFAYYLPLAWLGFHPLAITIVGGINLLYQFWIHTETIGNLGWFERWFNTPSHHRVHHGSNPRYIDKNFGGTLIVFDKWFGTFEPERVDEPVRYGLVKDIKTFNLFTVVFHEMIHMSKGAWNAPSWREKFLWVFGPPEWKPAAAAKAEDEALRHT
jgi:sterol desaturase/sphingolipid hydroxylase (fatty acid hydroxylase superfamily)